MFFRGRLSGTLLFAKIILTPNYPALCMQTCQVFTYDSLLFPAVIGKILAQVG